MSIDLPLGIPRPAGPESLLSALLSERFTQADEARTAKTASVCGPPIVSAASLLGRDGLELGKIVVDLDLDPTKLRGAPQAAYEAVRYQLDCPSDDLDDAIALRVPSPLAVYPTTDDPDLADAARALVDGGKIPGLGRGYSASAIADFLSVLAHADTGFVARADNASEVLSILAGTVASLRGDDVRRALESPNAAGLVSLIPEAASAVREVLIGIEVAAPVEIGAQLNALGLT